MILSGHRAAIWMLDVRRLALPVSKVIRNPEFSGLWRATTRTAPWVLVALLVLAAAFFLMTGIEMSKALRAPDHVGLEQKARAAMDTAPHVAGPILADLDGERWASDVTMVLGAGFAVLAIVGFIVLAATAERRRRVSNP